VLIALTTGLSVVVILIGMGIWLSYAGFITIKRSKSSPENPQHEAATKLDQANQDTCQVPTVYEFAGHFNKEAFFSRFQKYSFVKYNQAYVVRHQTGPLITGDLAHLTVSNLSSRQVQHQLPSLAKLVPVIASLANNPDFQDFFDLNLEFEEVTLRAMALISFIRLLDSTVRSSVVFSQAVPDVSPLVGCQNNSVLDDLAKEKLRQLIDENWKEMFSDVLQNPGSILVAPMVRQRIKGLTAGYHGGLDPDSILERLQQLLVQCPRTIHKLTEIVVIVALSPSLGAFSVEQVECQRFDSKFHSIIGESGSGNLNKVVIVIPALTTSTGRINRSLVYAINS
jgi:hypothetical protein